MPPENGPTKDQLGKLVEQGDPEETLEDAIGAAWDEAAEAVESEGNTEEQAKPNGEDKETEPAQEATDEEEQEEEREAGDEETGKEEEKIDAPQHWPEGDRERFAKLSREDQEWWLGKTKSLESGYQDKFTDLAEQRREAEALREIFKPHEQDMAMAGLDRITTVRQLVAAHNLLRTNPDHALVELAKGFRPKDPQAMVQALARAVGVDLGAVEQAEDIVDPVANQQIRALETRLNELQGTLSQSQQSAQQDQQRQAQTLLDQFAGAKDDKGNPKHPHFETVKEWMGGLIGSGAAKDLEDAYEQAVWASPELRQALLKEQAEAQAKEREEKRKKDVEKAKKASRQPKGDTAPAKDDGKQPKSLRESISQAWDEQESRV